MKGEERILEVLANALNGASVGPYRELPPPDEYFALYARSVWSRIDRDALRAALLADVRREVEELPWAKADGSDLDGSEGGLFVDADEFTEVVDRAAVLRLLGDQEVRRPGG